MAPTRLAALDPPAGRLASRPRPARSGLYPVLLALCLIGSSPAASQLQTGNLYGTVRDNQGEPLPGATVTLTGQGPTQVQVSGGDGQFRFLSLPPGTRQLKAALEGFSTVDYPNIVIQVGRNTTIEVTLSPAFSEELTVTNESPLLDSRKITTGTGLTQGELDQIPTARDPWVVLQTVPGSNDAAISVVGSEGQATKLVAGRVSSPQSFIDDSYLVLAWNEVDPTATSINVWSAHKPLDDFPAAGIEDPRIWDPSLFAGPVMLFDNGHAAYQNLTTHDLRFYDLNDHQARFLAAVPTGGAINSVYTGGRALTGMSFGDDYMIFQDEGQPPGSGGAEPGCTPFFGESRLKRHYLTSDGGPTSVQETTIVNTRPGPFGPGCFPAFKQADTVDLGEALPPFCPPDEDFDFESISPRLGVTYALGPERKTLIRGSYARFVEQLSQGQITSVGSAYAYFYFSQTGDDSSYDDLVDIKVDAISDPVSGTSYVPIPGGIVEDSADRIVLGLDPDLVFTTAPKPVGYEGTFTSSLSIRGDSAYQIGNYRDDSFSSGPFQLADAAGGSMPRPRIVPLPGCVDNDRTFCGLDNRYSVKVDWRTRDGRTGTGHARALSGDSGSFWFFSRQNRELLVKTLDGCALNGRRWFFASGLTDLQVDISVQDTFTHQGRHYTSGFGPFVPILDTQGFPCNEQEIAEARERELAGPSAAGVGRLGVGGSSLDAGRGELLDGTACGGEPSSVCLNDKRFRLDVSWTKANGEQGTGVGGRLENETGVFWFFTENNYELVGKVLDGCDLNNHFWLFAGGLTNVGVTLEVTDTETGATKRYQHPAGRPFDTITDTSAFATCP